MAQAVANAPSNSGSKKERKPKVHRTGEQKALLQAVASMRTDSILIRDFVRSGKTISFAAVIAAKNVLASINALLIAMQEGSKSVETK